MTSDKNHPRSYNPHNFRNWWFGKKQIFLGAVAIPKELHGKKIRFKIEIVKEKSLEIIKEKN